MIRSVCFLLSGDPWLLKNVCKSAVDSDPSSTVRKVRCLSKFGAGIYQLAVTATKELPKVAVLHRCIGFAIRIFSTFCSTHGCEH